MKKEKNNHPDNHKVEEEYAAYDEPFERYEIINNIRYDLKPSPSVVHQVIVTELNQSLRLTCPSEGIVIVAPMDVHLDENNTVQPDIIFIRNENFHIIKNERIEGTPDLLVEILSPSSGSHDRIRKKALYETFGVNEYWIVDPVHFTIDQFVLEQRKYKLNEVYGEGDTITSPILACARVDVTTLFGKAKKFGK